MVGEGHRGVLAAIDGEQRHIGRMNAHLVAGVIAGARAVGLRIPVQEHLTLGGGHAGGSLNVGIAALGVHPAVRGSSAGATVQVIGNTKALGAGIVWIKFDVAIDAGIEVEGRVHIVAFSTRADAPAAPSVAFGHSDLRQCTFIDGFAVGDLNLLEVNAFNAQIRLAADFRRSPLGIDGNIFRRHCTVEIICYCAGSVCKPALKLIG